MYYEVPEELQTRIAGGSSTDPVECLTLDEALTDIFENLEDLEETVDFSDFTSDCLDLTDEPTLNEIITELDEELCELKEAVEELTMCNLLDQEIDDCVDVSCLEELEDVCENPLGITTYKELIQALINKVCELSAE